MSVFQQSVITGEVSGTKVGLSALFGFVGGAINGSARFSGTADAFVWLLLNAGQAAIEEFMEKDKSRIEVCFIPRVEMQYAY